MTPFDAPDPLCLPLDQMPLPALREAPCVPWLGDTLEPPTPRLARPAAPETPPPRPGADRGTVLVLCAAMVASASLCVLGVTASVLLVLLLAG